MTGVFQVVGGDYSSVGYYILLFGNVIPTAAYRVESSRVEEDCLEDEGEMTATKW
jgi:hypothetical protein